ncbi:hypothetical protein DF286_04760 [Sphingosinicella humi]|uniref:PilZ domain-containing protein n=1 Tax=Allosphingosinicella humi TaxID=2068657 RepID=A0A2U2J1Q9_9SPHN|nr:hypothetical protein DF286_04760 [Sphingosinicella humi]
MKETMGVNALTDMPQAGKRRIKRARVLLTARLRTGAGEVGARLRDLSCKGALVECSEPLAVGDEVVFVRGDTIVSARVAWTAPGRLGLEFHHSIDESEVLVHVAKPSAKAPERFRRPRIHGEDLTDHERKLARIFARSVGIDITRS